MSRTVVLPDLLIRPEDRAVDIYIKCGVDNISNSQEFTSDGSHLAFEPDASDKYAGC